MIEIYTDGSAKDNGKENNCGGFGLCCLVPDENALSGYHLDYYVSKQIKNVTNNQMELKAILTALILTQTRYKNQKCVIKSDSAYCVNMLNEWIYNWARNGWVRAKNQPVENLELVQKIWEYLKIEWPNFYITRIPGHSGLLGNELADALATSNEAKFQKILEENELLYEK